ncbi:methyltransferase domain-containing protein [Streptomyces sp. NPDC045470]|uniref:methyltransferase domain-containing protein n=1 Tax=Streptomyces sp. NPDC045470 TaxID=3155469 RepID=UPI0033EFAF82
MTVPPQVHAGQAALVGRLAERGLLAPPWRGVWERIPREHWLPEQIWVQRPDRCEPVPVTDADARYRLTYSDSPVVTQVDDGRAGGPGVATSANSMPSMVAKMLGLLGLEDGMTVLEIGTATGDVASKLCLRVGDDKVTSVEIDAGLATRARANLARAGLAPAVHVTDGAGGWAPGAPYDRVIATCALRTVPSALPRQLRPGGVLVAPLVRDFASGLLSRFVKDATTGAVTGSFHGGASYMPLRAHRSTASSAVDGTTPRHCHELLDGQPDAFTDLAFGLYAGSRLPGVHMTGSPDRLFLWDGAGAGVLAEEGWAAVYGRGRDLWQELLHVWQEYVADGRPPLSDFGVTLTEDGGFRTWLRTPDAVVGPALTVPARRL